MSNIHKKFEQLFEILGGVFIVLVFATIGMIAGFVLYYLISGTTGKVAGIVTWVIFLIIGTRIAIKAYKGKGTMHLLSRSSASPDLDNEQGA